MEKDNDICGLHTNLKNDEIMLDGRTSELHAVQAFLSKIDLISQADVLAMAQKVNSKIFQLSLLMVDGITFENKEVLYFIS